MNPGVWFFPDAEMAPIREKVWQVGDFAFCKEYTDKAALGRELRLYDWLTDCGLPVISTYLTVDGLEWYAHGGRFYHLAKRLPGEHLRYPLSEPERFGRLYGETLRRVHDALAKCPFADEFRENDLCDELDGWVTEALAGNDEFLQDVREVSAGLRSYAPALPRQLIHRDPHGENLLFRGNELTGVLDFELCRTDYRLMDAAYLLSSVLDWEHWQEPSILNRFHRFTGAYLDAYRPTEAEREALLLMLRAVALIFIPFWKDEKRRAQVIGLARLFRDPKILM